MVKSFMIVLCMLTGLTCISLEKKKHRVLIYSKTAGFHHESIAAGIQAIQKMGLENNFKVDSTTDSTFFTSKNLKKYNAVIFLNTSGNVLDNNGKAAFEKYIRSGGGFVGVHAASDTEFDWEWFNRLVGAQFKNHPHQQDAVMHVKDKSFIATRHLPEVWKRHDEWYNFKNIKIDDSYKILITIDENSYKGGENGNLHPISWCHPFEGGRSFYTALGHGNEAYSDPLFLQHLLGGIKYAVNGINE